MDIEPLESRIAPAALIFTVVDGDEVAVNTSAGDVSAHGTVVGGQLQLLDLTDASFQGASISVKVAKAAGGDGLVNIGRINATLRDLGSVTIPGDLAVLDAGDGNTADGAVKSLSVRSIGIYGGATQAAGGHGVQSQRRPRRAQGRGRFRKLVSPRRGRLGREDRQRLDRRLAGRRRCDSQRAHRDERRSRRGENRPPSRGRRGRGFGLRSNPAAASAR